MAATFKAKDLTSKAKEDLQGLGFQAKDMTSKAKVKD